MKIDRKAEALGRAIVRWAGAGEREKFLDALAELSKSEPRLRENVVPIYVGVAALANRSIYDGGTPSQKQNQALAERLLQKYPWDVVDLRTVFNFLEKISVPDKQVEIDTPESIAAVFLVVGYIIVWYCQNVGYSDPYEFLDSLLNTLASLPE